MRFKLYAVKGNHTRIDFAGANVSVDTWSAGTPRQPPLFAILTKYQRDVMPLFMFPTVSCTRRSVILSHFYIRGEPYAQFVTYYIRPTAVANVSARQSVTLSITGEKAVKHYRRILQFGARTKCLTYLSSFSAQWHLGNWQNRLCLCKLVNTASICFA